MGPILPDDGLPMRLRLHAGMFPGGRRWMLPSAHQFPHSVFPGRSVVNQLETLWPGGAPARTAYVVSPFFDKPPADGVALTGLLPLLAKRRPRELCFYVRADSQPDGRIRVFRAPRHAQVGPPNQ